MNQLADFVIFNECPELELTPKQLEWWDAQTNTMRTIAGNFDIMVGGNSKDAELQVKTLTLQ